VSRLKLTIYSFRGPDLFIGAFISTEIQDGERMSAAQGMSTPVYHLHTQQFQVAFESGAVASTKIGDGEGMPVEGKSGHQFIIYCIGGSKWSSEISVGTVIPDGEKMPAVESISTSSVPSTSLTILSCFESGAAVGTEVKVGERISVAGGMSASTSRYEPRNSKLLPGTS
jgi:hypothetical protein